MVKLRSGSIDLTVSILIDYMFLFLINFAILMVTVSFELSDSFSLYLLASQLLADESL